MCALPFPVSLLSLAVFDRPMCKCVVMMAVVERALFSAVL